MYFVVLQLRSLNGELSSRGVVCDNLHWSFGDDGRRGFES